MHWYSVALIVLGACCCGWGFMIAVRYTDEIMGPSPELTPTLFMWLMLTILGPLTVACWLTYITIKKKRTQAFGSK